MVIDEAQERIDREPTPMYCSECPFASVELCRNQCMEEHEHDVKL